MWQWWHNLGWQGNLSLAACVLSVFTWVIQGFTLRTQWRITKQLRETQQLLRPNHRRPPDL